MTKVIRDLAEWKVIRGSEELRGKTVGFVPTMGALHAGHISLFERSKTENDFTIASIFVNPTQFDDAKDLAAYPRTLDDDLARLEGAGVDYLLLPNNVEMYPDGFRYKVMENSLSRDLCGEHRPGHFDGVLTVVMKLLNLAAADRAYFGEKDFQQFLLVKGMARAFFISTEIVGCPIVREEDGLAMSSRNARLNQDARQKASKFPQILGSGLDSKEVRQALENEGFVVDYVEDRNGRRFGAVRLGEIRLIDNTRVQSPLEETSL